MGTVTIVTHAGKNAGAIQMLKDRIAQDEKTLDEYKARLRSLTHGNLIGKVLYIYEDDSYTIKQFKITKKNLVKVVVGSGDNDYSVRDKDGRLQDAFDTEKDAAIFARNDLSDAIEDGESDLLNNKEEMDDLKNQMNMCFNEDKAYKKRIKHLKGKLAEVNKMLKKK